MVSAIVYILVVIFGSSSWLSTNAIWMELSLYTQVNPEGWNLPSYLTVAIQLACVGPLLYSIVHKCTKVNVPKVPLILILLISCSIFMFLLAFTWQKTLFLFGTQRSIFLIVFTFLMAIVNATSNVLFLPHMANFHKTYLTAYFVGMSFSSLVPSGIKLIQGVPNSVQCQMTNGSISYENSKSNPWFDVREYNLIMFGWLCLATISFAALHWFSPDSAKRRNSDERIKRSASKEKSLNKDDDDEITHSNDENETKAIRGTKRRGSQGSIQKVEEAPTDGIKRYYILIACLAIICALMNTVVPSIQSYAALPYSLITYHLALTLNNLTHPVANFLPLWIKPKKLEILVGLTFLCTLLTALIFMLALQSPEPIFYKTAYGGAIPVFASVVFGFMASYLRTHIVAVLRSEHHDDESRLFWCGLFMQIGSFFGAFLMFPLVNVWSLFQRAPPPPCS